MWTCQIWYKLLSEERAQAPQVPSPQQQNRKVTEVTEVTPSYAAAPATKLGGGGQKSHMQNVRSGVYGHESGRSDYGGGLK